MDGIMAKETVVSSYGSYQQYKEELDKELTQAAEGFVRIGYLLKVARDTDILKESGYENVVDFAKAEYGIDKTQVSRFIHINDRFAEGGYSDRLEEKYRRFGYAKLTIMLQLPDEINEELPDSLSKAEVQEIREEVEAEQNISEIELAIEKTEVAPVQQETQTEDLLLHQAAAQLCREQQDLFRKLWDEQNDLENMQDTLVPQGEAVLMVRIPGTGRLMISIKDQETSITNVRSNEKERYETSIFLNEIRNICAQGQSPEEAFRIEFGEEMEAPAPERTVEDVKSKEPKQRKESKVTKAKTVKEEPAAAVEEPVEEEQLPGQMDVNDYPEILPDGVETGVEEANENGEAGNELAGSGDGQEYQQAGNNTGEQESDDSAEHNEVNGAAEDDGCTADNEAIGQQDAEEEAWVEARNAVINLQRQFNAYFGHEKDVTTSTVKCLYNKAINAAAALEKILMERERKHE